MSGISNILRTFFDLLAAAGLDLSIRQRVGMVAILVVLLAPALLRSVGVSQARSRVMATRLLDGPARQEAEDQALAAARGKARQLVAVAETALSLGRSRLAAAAVEALAETGEEKESLRALRRKMAPVVPLPATPDEVILVAERLLEAGMEAEADRRLSHARAKWPELPDVATLKVNLPRG